METFGGPDFLLSRLRLLHDLAFLQALSAHRPHRKFEELNIRCIDSVQTRVGSIFGMQAVPPVPC